LLQLASEANLMLLEIGSSLAALPSETVDFNDQRLRCGRAAPSQLPSRRELRKRGIATAYYDHPNQQHRLDSDAPALLLWSSFPDNTYKDSGARFAQHFQQIHEVLKTAWLNTVQQIPAGRKILVTSDHGYVFFGSGLSFPRSNDDVRPLTHYLGGERYRRFSEEDEPPPEHPDLAVYREQGLAIIRGRVQTHPPGQAANKLYKHGGLSIMEMLVPWLVLEG